MRNDTANLNDNMVWNPLDKQWIYINCYDHHFRTEDQKNAYKKYLKKCEDMGDAVDKVFGLSSK